MNIVLYVLTCAVSALFGLLSLVAAVSQWRTQKQKVPAGIMGFGSVLLLAAVVCSLCRVRLDWLLALAGCALICGTAVYNGVSAKNVHVPHHIIRVGLSALLVAGFLLL